MNPIAKDMLMHYGMPKRSGRYPWGSGDDPYQHNQDFLSRVEDLKKSGFTETPENIMKEFGLTTSQYRTEKAICNNERRMYLYAKVKSLADEKKGATEIGRELGMSESSVRSMLDAKSADRMMEAKKYANFIKEQVDSKGMIDIGVGTALELGISKEKLNQSLYLLEREGYPVWNGRFPQPTNPGQWTTQKVICLPGTEHKEIYKLDKVHSLNEDDYRFHEDIDGPKQFTYPKSMDSKRLMIRYAEDGGIDKDGLVELRRNVEDISLGDKSYSQVRILVDDNRYIKGMAAYSDNMPDGVDVIFNTNKSKSVPKMEVLKQIKEDPDNPFGSLVKANGQRWYKDKDGNEQMSLINKTREENDWDDWSNGLPSQFLAKQALPMINKQLGLAKADKQAEFDSYMSLNNPTIKKHLLEKFADNCDAAAVNLKAAALPGQKYHVIMPVKSLKDGEVYAPNYENGSKLALIRYPHGGTFEIPILTVNNKNQESQKLIGKGAIDAVCITKKVADRLSGADFDGDTVMCIPTNDKNGKVKITSTHQLDDLINFDNKASYQYDDVKIGADGKEHYYQNGVEFKRMTKKGTQTQMGVVSNLITDMTLIGADEKDLVKAVKHSMVVIDAEKHKLNYKQSEIDNNIAALKKKYQIKEVDEYGNVTKSGGASTLLSRAKGQEQVDKRQGTPKINIAGTKDYDPSRPEGALLYKTADDLYHPVRDKYDKTTGLMTLRTTDGKKLTYNVKNTPDREKYEPYIEKDQKGKPIYKRDKSGNVVITNRDGSISYKVAASKQESTKMAETDDAMTLVSKARHPKEIAYAEYANSMKALANQARKEMVNTGKIEYKASAKKTYQKEVSELNAKLNNALLNASKERAASRKAVADVQAKRLANPNMEKSDVKKASQRALSKYRNEVGSVSRKDRNIDITDREWEAIQAGAISETQLKKILNNTDVDKLRERATPRTMNTLSNAQINRVKALSASNYTIGEIASKLGISTSSVSKYLK